MSHSNKFEKTLAEIDDMSKDEFFRLYQIGKEISKEKMWDEVNKLDEEKKYAFIHLGIAYEADLKEKD